jgi:pyrroloquinoline quinone biosynthesis protein D
MASDIVATTIAPASRPQLSAHMRMRWDAARERHVLLGPESVTMLNRTGAAILGLCDGQRSVAEIVDALRESYRDVSGNEVADYLARLANNRCVEVPNDE